MRTAVEREGWCIEHGALMQYGEHKCTVWVAGHGYAEGASPAEAIARMQIMMGAARPTLSLAAAKALVDRTVDDLATELSRTGQLPNMPREEWASHMRVSFFALLYEQYAIVEEEP
jgi:hypothetical protein